MVRAVVLRSWETRVFIVDIDKDGYIDQSEINVMAKVGHPRD